MRLVRGTLAGLGATTLLALSACAQKGGTASVAPVAPAATTSATGVVEIAVPTSSVPTSSAAVTAPATASAAASAGQTSLPEPTTTASPSDRATPQQRLSAPRSVDQGNSRFDVPAATDTATVSAGEAYSAYSATGVYSQTLTGRTPRTYFALYTGVARDTSPTSRRRIPVWVFEWDGVPLEPSGPAGTVGTASPSPRPTYLSDVFAVVDAHTGQPLSVLAGGLDR